MITTIIKGKVSFFGGPFDSGVSPSEGLALFAQSDIGRPIAQGLFLPRQPPNTTGLARRLDPNAKYIAMRWDYDELSRSKLRNMTVTVEAKGKKITGVRPVDWGPHITTRRAMDLSYGLGYELNLQTDEYATVTITYNP